MNIVGGVCLSAVICLAIPLAAFADDSAISVSDGPYTRVATGMIYLATVGDFRRVGITISGKDEVARYERNVPMSEIVVSVHVYKGPGLTLVGSPPPAIVLEALHRGICFGNADASMKALAPDATGSTPAETSLRRGMFTSHGRYKAAYSLTMPTFFARSQVAVESDLYRFCFLGVKNLSVEYRFDYPRGVDAGRDIAGFMHDLDWSFL